VRSLPILVNLICVHRSTHARSVRDVFAGPNAWISLGTIALSRFLLRVRVLLLLLYCHCCRLSSLFCTHVPLYAYLFHGGAYFLNYLQLE
jgi:hypothetical protein